MFQGQVVCRSGASLRRRRGRQAVFGGQFLATWASTGAQRHRQAVFREQFLPTWALTGAHVDTGQNPADRPSRRGVKKRWAKKA